MDVVEEASQEMQPSVPIENNKFRLIRISLIAAIILEVVPLEAGLLHIAVVSKNVALYIAIKCLCLFLILSPLAKHFWRNGQKLTRKTALALFLIALIMIINLMMNAVVISRMIE